MSSRQYADILKTSNAEGMTLETVNDIDLPLFSYEDMSMDVKVTSVYDGDTFTGCFFENDVLKKYKFRCMGYDSEEMRQSRTSTDREEAKARAIEDRQYFINLVDQYSHNTRILTCRFGKFDKYGRILVYLPTDGSINRAMVESGHGYAYNGGTKKHNIT